MVLCKLCPPTVPLASLSSVLWSWQCELSSCAMQASQMSLRCSQCQCGCLFVCLEMMYEKKTKKNTQMSAACQQFICLGLS